MCTWILHLNIGHLERLPEPFEHRSLGYVRHPDANFGLRLGVAAVRSCVLSATSLHMMASNTSRTLLGRLYTCGALWGPESRDCQA